MVGKLISKKFCVGDESIENVREYKYLGIILSISGSFTNAKESLYKKSLKAYFKLKNLLHSLPNPKLGSHLFNHTVVPILTYCSEIWGLFNPTIRNIDTLPR